MFRRTHCICMAKLFSYQLLFGASIWSASVFSLYFDSGWISFRYYCDDARFEFSIHFNHFTCYRTLSLSPTKWYTIKQFKFIWAWDQSFVCGWFFSSSFVCVCPGFYGWLRPFAPIVFTFLHHFSKCSGEMVHFLRHLIRTNHADSEPMARLPMLNMKWTL